MVLKGFLVQLRKIKINVIRLINYFLSFISFLYINSNFQFSSVQFNSDAQSCPTLCDTMNCSCQASLSITNFRSSPKLMCIDLVMPSIHLILCRPLLLLPPIRPSIRVFSNESPPRMRLTSCIM